MVATGLDLWLISIRLNPVLLKFMAAFAHDLVTSEGNTAGPALKLKIRFSMFCPQTVCEFPTKLEEIGNKKGLIFQPFLDITVQFGMVFATIPNVWVHPPQTGNCNQLHRTRP